MWRTEAVERGVSVEAAPFLVRVGSGSACLRKLQSRRQRAVTPNSLSHRAANSDRRDRHTSCHASDTDNHPGRYLRDTAGTHRAGNPVADAGPDRRTAASVIGPVAPNGDSSPNIDPPPDTDIDTGADSDSRVPHVHGLWGSPAPQWRLERFVRVEPGIRDSLRERAAPIR